MNENELPFMKSAGTCSCLHLQPATVFATVCLASIVFIDAVMMKPCAFCPVLMPRSSTELRAFDFLRVCSLVCAGVTVNHT